MLPAINFPVVAAVGAGLLALGGVGGYRLCAVIEDAKQAARLEAIDRYDSRVAEEVAVLRTEYQTLGAGIKEVVDANEVYRNCLVDADAKRMLDDARQGKRPSSGILPTAGGK